MVRKGISGWIGTRGRRASTYVDFKRERSGKWKSGEIDGCQKNVHRNLYNEEFHYARAPIPLEPSYDGDGASIGISNDVLHRPR